MRVLPVLLIAVCAGCEMEAPPAQQSAAALHRDHDNPNPALYQKDARPFGISQERWIELAWTYIYRQPFDHNPFFDLTGADCAAGQAGPVWFLPAVPGSALGTEITRHCTIPRHRALALQLSSIINDFPCPDPNFKPAPGQTLYDFLIDAIGPLIDAVQNFAVTIDGVAIQDVLSYRFSSDDLFRFTGDPSMQAFDSCVTGSRQPAVVDGFQLLFKPLPPGAHTIVVHGQDMLGTPVVLTEELTIQ